MPYTENFKKAKDEDVTPSEIISMYREIYDNRLSRNWPVPTLTSSNELGKLFGYKRSGSWTGGSESEIKQYHEVKVKAFQYLYELSHYGESRTVLQHAPYAKTFPAFNASSRLATGSEIFSSYYNELERYKNDISPSRGNIGCSSGCTGTCSTSCSDDCVKGCSDDNCENSCSSGGATSCSSSDCGSQCSSYCVKAAAEGCGVDCSSDCKNSCEDDCTSGCSGDGNECVACSAMCTSACLGQSSKITEYVYGCDSSSSSTSQGTDYKSSCNNGCGKTSTMGDGSSATCNSCGKTSTSGTGCAVGCGKVAK